MSPRAAHPLSSPIPDPSPASMRRPGGWRTAPRAVPDIQPLGASERLFARLRRHSATNVTRVIALEGRLAPQTVQAALRLLAVRHPLLRAHLVDGDFPYFVHGDTPAPRLHVVARRDDEHFRTVLERVLNTPLAQAPGPLLEVHYVYAEHAERAELIVVAEHVICDGVSMNRLCGELLELCAR